MADKKPFNFEDWMAIRKTQLPGITSQYRKKFDVTPNTWMEDPDIWARAKKAAEIDPNFGNELRKVNAEGISNADNPTFTEQFISRLNELVPDTVDFPKAEAELSAHKAAIRKLQEQVKNAPESIIGTGTARPTTATTKPAELLSDEVLGPIIAERMGKTSTSVPPKDVNVLENIIRGARPVTPSMPESIAPTLAGKRGEIIADRLEQARQIQKAKQEELLNKNFLLKGEPVSTAPTKEDIKRDFLRKLAEDQHRKAIESGRFELKGEPTTVTPSPQDEKFRFSTRFAAEKNRPEMVQGPASYSDIPSSSDIKKDFIQNRINEARARINASYIPDDVSTFDTLRPLYGDLTEELGRTPTGKEVLKALGSFGSEKADKLAQATGKIISSKPAQIVGRGILAPVALGLEGKKAVEDINKGEYTDALSSGLGAGSAMATILGSEAAIPLAAGQLAVSGGKELGKQQAELADQGISYDPASGMTRSEEELPESIRNAKYEESEEPEDSEEENGPIPSPAPTPPSSPKSIQPKDRTRFDELKDIYENKLKTYPEYKQDRGPASVGGIEEAEPSRSPASIEEEQTKREIPKQHDIKNLVYIRSKESNIPPALGLAFAEQESGFDPTKPKNEAGAGGLMQITPIAHKDVQMHVNPSYLKDVKHEDLMNPRNYDTNLKTGLDFLNLAMKREKLPQDFDITNRDNVLKLTKRWFGAGTYTDPNTGEQMTAEDYTDQLMPRILKYDKMVKEYEDKNKINESSVANKEDESKIAVPDALNNVLNIYKGALKANPATMLQANVLYPGAAALLKKAGLNIPSIVSQSEYDKSKDQLAGNVPSLPFSESDDNAPVPVTVAQGAEEEKVPETSKGKEKFDASDLVKQLQEEGKDERAMKLMAMQNLLRSQAMAPIAKGLALMASGVVGAKDKYTTVPKLEGMETFDQMERAPASMLAMQEMMAKDKYDDPNSGVSKAYRRFAAETFKRINPDFDESKLEGLSANSVKTLMPLGMKEEGLLLKKLLGEGKPELQKIKENAITFRNLPKAIESIGGPAGTKLRLRIQQAGNIYGTLGVNPSDLEKMSDKEIETRLDENKKLQAVEAAIEANAMLAGQGNPSQKTLEKLLLDSGYKKGMDALSYVSNRQFALKQGKYLKDIVKLTARVEKTAMDRLRDMEIRALSGYTRLAKDPNVGEDFINFINQRGISLDDLKAKQPSQQQTQSISEEMVKVKSPEGKIGKLPKSKLQQALDEGFTEVK